MVCCVVSDTGYTLPLYTHSRLLCAGRRNTYLNCSLEHRFNLQKLRLPFSTYKSCAFDFHFHFHNRTQHFLPRARGLQFSLLALRRVTTRASFAITRPTQTVMNTQTNDHVCTSTMTRHCDVSDSLDSTSTTERSTSQKNNMTDLRRVRDSVPWRLWAVAAISLFERAAFWALLAPWRKCSVPLHSHALCPARS